MSVLNTKRKCGNCKGTGFAYLDDAHIVVDDIELSVQHYLLLKGSCDKVYVSGDVLNKRLFFKSGNIKGLMMAKIIDV